jgi:large conductance mechanosensitive channel
MVNQVRTEVGKQLSGFKKFVLRGNVVDLAVGVVMGAAFNAVVQSFVKAIINPLIGLFGRGNFDGYLLHVGSTRRPHVFPYGTMLTAILNLLISALVIYFLVVRPINALRERFKTEPDVPTPTKTCPECKSSIPYDATRCAFCTVELAAAA